jgi:tripartite-type tricarboxylate transporter receptor subunit TctC
MTSGIETRVLALLTVVLLAGARPAAADSVEDFYKGKTLEITVGTGEGPGPTSAYPLALAQFMGSYIPGHPHVVVSYLPGGAGIKAGNFIYGVGPQDGTILGFLSRGFVLAPLLTTQAQYDPTKFQWIGSTAREISVGAIWTASTDVRTIQDAMKQEVIVGGTAASNDTGLFPLILNRFIGTKFKSVLGYKSTTDVEFAMERGEVQGKVGWTLGALNSLRTGTWVSSGKVRIIIQLGLEKSPELPANIPTAVELASNTGDRQVMSLVFGTVGMGYPAFMGPGVPKDRVAAVRDAFAKTMSDPGFIEMIKQQQFPVDPIGGSEIAKVVNDVYGLPLSVVQRARELIPPS